MTDVIALFELSDEQPRFEESASFGGDFSPRLAAVLDRMPNNSTGTATRVKGGLMNAGIFTLAALLAADRYTLGRKHLGRTSIATIDAALKHFGLHRVDENPPLVVRDGASVAEAHVQQLQTWIAKRLEACEKGIKRGPNGSAMRVNEIEVLSDVILILDGRAPTNKRTWVGDETRAREWREDE